MLFTSNIFLVFVVIFYLLYWKTRINKIYLINTASMVFYGAWNPLFLLLLLYSSILDYICAIKMSEMPKYRKVILFLSVFSNLSVLAFFKYYNFFTKALQDTFQTIGYSVPMASHLDIILPVGISFYTFQTMAYTIDVYRGDIKPNKNFGEFFCYVSFFPQLIAGPIERAKNIFPQLVNIRVTKNSNQRIEEGITLILRGYLKKVIIADNLAIYVDQVFSQLPDYSLASILVATSFFTIQIYCDFSGYTDIARGLAKLMGIDLMINFNYPYFSKNIREFWDRWHISLSTWLRDYLYISIGGSRGGTLFTYRNLMITMMLGGLWHGANYNFLLWGTYQGGLLVLYRIWSQRTFNKFQIPAFFSWGITMVCVLLGWYIFRMAHVEDLTTLLQKIVTPKSGMNFFPHLKLILIFMLFIFWQTWEYFGLKRKFDPFLLGILPRYTFFVMIATFYYFNKPISDQIFIYFQF
jgi:alginate O-acetyltransferase complex protein AlgI